ncbi:MAG: PEP-utilizing enzyme [Patescibacteria group bacterium]|nr:PEP-utilizing enzyme [Patescibacteria group bacterium]
MPLSQIKSIEFWAREYRLPLWWLNDPRHVFIGDNTFFLFKNPILHCYYVNGRMQKEHSSGQVYFSKADSFSRYIERSQKMVEKMQKSEADFFGQDLKSLTDKELYGVFDGFRFLLKDFTALYTKTEAEKLKKFEGVKDKKIKEELFKVGKIRFELRKSVESIFRILLGDVLKEIVRRFKIKSKDWFFYDCAEAQNLFNGRKVSSRVIAQRQKGYAVLNVNGKRELLVGNEYKKARALVKKMTAQKDDKILRGSVAQPGMVKGRVELVLHNVRDLTKKVNEFKVGNILVTEMTTPTTVVACKKASAIITDEGGVLCHAAIISRELKKPCIVGTKIATQVLHDGDKVEVDANNGTVTMLKRAA